MSKPLEIWRQKVDLIKLTGGGLSCAVRSSKMAGGPYEDNMNGSKAKGKKEGQERWWTLGGRSVQAYCQGGLRGCGCWPGAQ